LSARAARSSPSFANGEPVIGHAAHGVSQLAVTARHSHALAAPLPPPWTAEETDACFIVRDAKGQALG